MAEESPTNLVVLEGGVSTITNESDGMMAITVQDITPSFNVSIGNETFLMPIERFSRYSFPFNAAVVFSGDNGESTSLVEISNVTLSDDNEVLILQVKALEFYEGEALKAFESDKQDVTADETEEYTKTIIHVEILDATPDNDDMSIECYKECQEEYNECPRDTPHGCDDAYTACMSKCNCGSGMQLC